VSSTKGTKLISPSY